jgi:hypothetical protein
MAVYLDLDAIQPGSLHVLRRCCIIPNDALDIPVFDRFGE